MKTHLFHVRLSAAFAAIAFLFPACERGPKQTDIQGFCQAVFAAAKANDTAKLVNQYSMSQRDMAEYVRRFNARHPGMALSTPDVTKEQISAMTQEALQVFLDSYRDLFQYELARYSARVDEQMGMTSVVIWVKTPDSFQGILINSLVQTDNGYKVNNWLGPIAEPSKSMSSLRKMRARLHSSSEDSCVYPQSEITYEYEFVK